MADASFPVSDHCDGRRFFDPHGPAPRGFRDLPRWRWQQLTSHPPARWPESVALTRQPELPANIAPGQVAVTFIGHATFLLQFPEPTRKVPTPNETSKQAVGRSGDTLVAVSEPRATGLSPLREIPGFTVLTDPVFARCAGPWGRFGPPRVRPPGIAEKNLPHIDIVLLSHNHYDHLDLAALRRLARTHRPLIVTPLGLGAWLEARGVPGTVELDWWQSHLVNSDRETGPALFSDAGDAPPPARLPDRGEGTAAPDASRRPSPFTGMHRKTVTHSFEIICTPAQHWSSRHPWDRCRTLWGGFLLKTPHGSVYFCGDSGWAPKHFAAIREKLGAPDLALLPIGAYEPRWFMEPVHMNPDEAVRAHLALGARRSVGMHFGTFQLTDEAIDAPLHALAAARELHGVATEDFTTFDFGETRLCVMEARN